MQENNQLPWERPRVKRIMELFPNSKVINIKKMTSIKRENKEDEIYR